MVKYLSCINPKHKNLIRNIQFYTCLWRSAPILSDLVLATISRMPNLRFWKVSIEACVEMFKTDEMGVRINPYYGVREERLRRVKEFEGWEVLKGKLEGLDIEWRELTCGPESRRWVGGQGRILANWVGSVMGGERTRYGILEDEVRKVVLRG